MKRLVTLLLLLPFWFCSRLHAQGCSDAGVCTIHPVKTFTANGPDRPLAKNEIRLGTGYARGERGTNILSLQLEYSRRFAGMFTLTGKLNYNKVNGEIGSTGGPGDLFLSVAKGSSGKKKWQRSVFAGLKIPLGTADKRKNGTSLPMVYQPTLGTTDLLAGVSFSRKQFGLSLAYQQPLDNPNKNQFLQSSYPAQHAAGNYPSTNQFSRKADLVGRITGNIVNSDHWVVQPGLLGIYHTGTDSYRNESGQRSGIDGSKGLTLNAILYTQFNTSKKSHIAISAGTPILVRTERPDGLTRKFVLSLEYAFRF